MKRLLYHMTGGQALLLLLSILSVVFILILFSFFEGIVARSLGVSIVVLYLVLAGRAALPAEAHRMRAARYGVWVFAGLLILIAGFRPSVEAILLSAARQSPILEPFVANLTFGNLSNGVMVVTLLMFVAYLWFLRDSSPTGKTGSDSLIRQPVYRDRRLSFAKVLRDRLATLDSDLNWHHDNFVNLKAEVDVRHKAQTRRRATDLVEAINFNKDSNLFIVIGVPGAGKSVALRKCCVSLLDRERVTERIPIYVNLKEWGATRRWTEQAPPTPSEFANFVSENIATRLFGPQLAFFEEHFERLLELGEIFFLFDSFDEIPALLDEDENSPLLAKVSDVVVQYLNSAPAGRGVIASRYFRRPQMRNIEHVELDVRPFTDRQIADAIRQKASQAEKLINIIQVKRPELGLLARNPFTLSLILEYWRRHHAEPENQSELYRDYIDEALSNIGPELKSRGGHAVDLPTFMTEMSWTMFENSNRGLEITATELREQPWARDSDLVIDMLEAARLVRRAPRTQAISFVHRRFNEYFLISKWLTGARETPVEAISTDSRYRDALVLYAEVAEDADAQHLIQHCWEQILDHLDANGASRMRVVYSLRFLTEAFRVRRKPLVHVLDGLGAAVNSILVEREDIALRKLAVEAVGILKPEDSERALSAALLIGNSWITETAFDACRYFQQLPPKIEDRLFESAAMRPQIEVLFPDPDFSFSLTVTDAFANLRRRLSALRADIALGVFAGVALLSLAELQIRAGLTFLIYIFLWSFFWPLLFSSIFLKRVNGVTSPPKLLILRPEIILGRIHSERLLLSEFVLGTLRLVPIFALFFCILYIITSLAIELKIGESGLAAAVALILGYIGLSLFCFPWFSWLFTSKRSPDERSALSQFLKLLHATLEFKTFISLSAYILAIVVISGGVFFFMEYVLGDFGKNSLALLLGIGASFFVLRLAFFALTAFWRDRKRLSATTLVFTPRRTVIAEEFSKFETETARLRYVEWVQKQVAQTNAAPDLKDDIANPWPNNRRPRIGDRDPASTLLAQLDLKWVGVDV